MLETEEIETVVSSRYGGLRGRASVIHFTEQHVVDYVLHTSLIFLNKLKHLLYHLFLLDIIIDYYTNNNKVLYHQCYFEVI